MIYPNAHNELARLAARLHVFELGAVLQRRGDEGRAHRVCRVAAIVEIPQAVKQQLGLDLERSWVVVNEGNQFVWPGYDLRKVPGRDEFHYGFLPPRFFDQVLTAARAYRTRKTMTMAER